MTTFFSGGTLVSAFTQPRPTSWAGTTDQIPSWLAATSMTYSAMYERQPWVATLIDKIAVSHSRLPFKVYQRNSDQDRVMSDGRYAQLMRQPCPYLSNFQLIRWTTSTYNIHGDAFWTKERDQRTNRPIAVHPRHPSRVLYVGAEDSWWLLDRHGRRERQIARVDLVHFRAYSPHETVAGMSPLEPLRSTLENEEGARRANSAMWRNGGRPSTVLAHPQQLSDGASKRLKTQWDQLFSGVDNWAKTVVLEEGMTPQFIPLNNDELAYIDSRKLNREEVCARFDIPPPVVHILDRATFSNVTEQMRSMYRDSMGWRIGELEATLDSELRDGSFGQFEPDFSTDEYGEFLMDEVLRGSFETRIDALNKSEFMTLAEKRRIENLPFIEGTDQIFLNSATLPLGRDGQLSQPAPSNSADPDLMRTLMGRLGRIDDVADVDVRALVDGLPDAAAQTVAAVVSLSSAGDMAELRSELRSALEGTS